MTIVFLTICASLSLAERNVIVNEYLSSNARVVFTEKTCEVTK